MFQSIQQVTIFLLGKLTLTVTGTMGVMVAEPLVHIGNYIMFRVLKLFQQLLAALHHAPRLRRSTLVVRRQRHSTLVNLRRQHLTLAIPRQRHLTHHDLRRGTPHFMRKIIRNKVLDSEVYDSITKQVNLVKEDANDLLLQEKYTCLQAVEEYLKEKCNDLDIELCFDQSAKENLFFKTMNYSTYAGFLIMHPLSPEQALRQMMDAYADNLNSVGHIAHIKNQIETKQNFSKYQFNKEIKNSEGKKVLVVLSGGNKLKKHTCIGKIQQICKQHGGENVIMKKHPISYDDVYFEFAQAVGCDFHFAERDEDLYTLIQSAEYVYTTMLSETALIANVLGKKVAHYDLFQNRETAPFYHINYFLFSTPDPVAWADRAFASPKSGIVHPDVDEDWKGKIDKYLDYIMELREFYRNAYIWR